MLTRLHQLRRRHRRLIVTAVAVLFAATAALAVHSALASADMHGSDDHAAVLCVVVGGCAALAGIATIAIPRLRRRVLWTIPAPAVPAVRAAAPATPFLVRAGPPPSLLQVFRL